MTENDANFNNYAYRKVMTAVDPSRRVWLKGSKETIRRTIYLDPADNRKHIWYYGKWIEVVHARYDYATVELY